MLLKKNCYHINTFAEIDKKSINKTKQAMNDEFSDEMINLKIKWIDSVFVSEIEYDMINDKDFAQDNRKTHTRVSKFIITILISSSR
jgi:hypothetical protein